MTLTELLPWLNVLLVPALHYLQSINTKLASFEATQKSHAGRLEKLDGIKT